MPRASSAAWWNTTRTDRVGAARGEEIAAWLAANAVDGYVIIDDHTDMGQLRAHLLLTHPAHGLRPDDVRTALATLTHPVNGASA